MSVEWDADERLDEGLRLFNEREFFACHDVWEDLWGEVTGPGKVFLQGLIQAAVSLFHFEGGNLGGALKMYRSCRACLSGFRPQHLGFDIDGLLSDLAVCFAELDQPHQSYPAHLLLDPERIPLLRRTRTHAESAAKPTIIPAPESAKDERAAENIRTSHQTASRASGGPRSESGGD